MRRTKLNDDLRVLDSDDSVEKDTLESLSGLIVRASMGVEKALADNGKAIQEAVKSIRNIKQEPVDVTIDSGFKSLRCTVTTRDRDGYIKEMLIEQVDETE